MKISRVIDFLTKRFNSEPMLPQGVVATTQPKTKAKIKKMPSIQKNKTKTAKSSSDKNKSTPKKNAAKKSSKKAKSSKK